MATRCIRVQKAFKLYTMALQTPLLVLLFSIKSVESFSARTWSIKDVPGIWKMKTTTPTPGECLLRIQGDGTFYESNDERRSRKGLLTGLWDYKETSNTLQLSVESEKEPMLLEGRLEERESSLAAKGKVFTGTRLYPQGHPSYFELYEPKEAGDFSLQQALGRFTVMPEESQVAEPKFQAADFYDKQFWLAVTPLPIKNRNLSPREDKRSVDDVMREEAVDIRIMPIDFYKNNTFCATGSEKLLRGRFGVNKRDQLWFQVSLFGAGRSVSGSVFSEGKGLNHEDERSYTGSIRENDNGDGLLVEGDVFVGSDLGSDARPEPVAVFTLKVRTTKKENQGDNDLFSELGAFE